MGLERRNPHLEQYLFPFSYLRFAFLFAFCFFYLRFLFFLFAFSFFLFVFYFFYLRFLFFFVCVFFFFCLRFLFCLCLSLLGHRMRQTEFHNSFFCTCCGNFTANQIMTYERY